MKFFQIVFLGNPSESIKPFKMAKKKKKWVVLEMFMQWNLIYLDQKCVLSHSFCIQEDQCK